MIAVAAENGGHRIKVADDLKENGAMQRECESSMKHSKKSDEELRAVSTTLVSLLIGCNFSQKLASYVVECSGRELHYTELMEV